LRGGKYTIFEGGTRVPFILRWPGRVMPGVSDALVCLMDFPASFAALIGAKIPVGDAPDSVNILPALLGDSKIGRDKLVEHNGAQVLGFRDGQWKFIEPRKMANAETGAARSPQLYNLADDLGEVKNLNTTQPDASRKLANELEAVQQAGGRAGNNFNPQ